MALDREQVKGIVTDLLREAAGFDDEISSAQKQALDYYFMRPRGDEVAGRSQVVSGDLSAMTEANLAQMLDSFTGDRICEFDGEDSEDETQAQLESDAVASVIMDQNNGFLIFVESIKDALLCRKGINKAWISEKPRTRTRTYEDVEPEAFAELTNRQDVTVDVLDYDPEAKTLKLRETKLNRKLIVESVPVENFVYTKNWHKLDLADIPLCGERHVDIRSDLIDRGFDKSTVNSLPAYVEHTQASTARNPKGQNTMPTNQTDKSLDLIEWFELYVLLDVDGDGIAERRAISLVPNEALLEDEPADMVQYAVGSALINPHRLEGISLFDKLKQTQDWSTGLMRAVQDNSQEINRITKVYLQGRVDEDALSDGAVGSNIPVLPPTQDVRQAVAALTVPDITGGIQANLEASKRNRAELGGAALDMAQANLQLNDRVGSEGLDRAYSVMEQLAAMMTRTLAESLARNTFKLVHELMRRRIDTPMQVKLKGVWHTITPADWPERDQLTCKLGMSPGERKRKADALGFVLDAQLKLAGEGMNNILVNLPGFYQALMDWCRVNELTNPEQYFIDPDSDESKEASKQKDQQSKAERDAQKRLMDAALGLEQLRVSLDKRNSDADRVLEYFKAVLQSETKEADIVGRVTGDLEKLQMQGQHQEKPNGDGGKDSSAADS